MQATPITTTSSPAKRGRPPRQRREPRPENPLQEVSANSSVEVPERVRLELNRMKQYFPYRYVFAVLEKGEWSVFTKYTRHTMNHKARIGCPVFIQERAL
ncbi:hypothetical protein [Comamonas thiooxydans]|uniref:hypothetical protein n=1 Tax=Comamonas thiooxydans TaxID=363952 RepID=UPI000A8B205C|nr:hypothetical protein [Comamonas thiooxydans]